MNSHYNNNLKIFSQKLRKQGTKGEAILWRDVLKSRQMKGYQFNRQYAIDNYIVDFIARKLKLELKLTAIHTLANRKRITTDKTN